MKIEIVIHIHKVNCQNILKHIEIHPTVFGILLVSFFFKYFPLMIMMYGIVFIHEMFHLIAALLFHIEVDCLRVMPFGMTIKIKRNYIRNPVQEIIIAAAGPSSNILMILCAYLLKSYCLLNTDNMNFFIYGNISIAVINLVPILPLDGGRILRAALTFYIGFRKASHISMITTKLFIVLLVIAGALNIYLTGFNISILLIACFLIFNLFAEKTNKHLVLMKEIIYSREKLENGGISTAKNLVVLYNVHAQKLIQYFSYNHFYLITVIDQQMNILGVLTEAQVIQGMVQCGSRVTMKELVDWISADGE